MNQKKPLKLQNNKGFLEFPCKKYPKSYALKHWQIGKSWLSWLNAYTSHMRSTLGHSNAYEQSLTSSY